MPRNSGGTYTLASGNPVVAGTRITAAHENSTVSDMAAELTDSLSRSGRGGMTAPLRGVSGTAAAPGLSFTAEPGSGLYRSAAGDIRLSRLGVDVLKAASDMVGAAIWGTLAAASAILRGAVADGASAVGVILDNSVTLADAAAKLVSVRNNGAEKAYFDKDGHLIGPGTIRAWGTLTLGAAPAVIVTAGFNVASATWSSVSQAGSIILSSPLPSTDAVVLLVQLGALGGTEIPVAEVASTTQLNFLRSAGMAPGQVYGFIVVA